MTGPHIDAAAAELLRAWRASARISELPPSVRPTTRADGYAIQARLAELTGQPVVGWKIAATSAAGQSHIHVDGPIAGRLFGDRLLATGAEVSLSGNLMRLAEAEFAFRLSRDLEPRGRAFGVEDVLEAVDSLHLSLEIPDSRYLDCTRVGAAQLIADDACADWLVLSPAVAASWRDLDLAAHEVHAYRNDRKVASGRGANVLGDPRLALAWLANELVEHGHTLRAGQIVTTGTCIVPMAVAPGDEVRMDFGVLGSVGARFV